MPAAPSASHRAIVFVHDEAEGPVTLEPALRRAGFTVEQRVREVREGDEAADLVVVMGGPMGVYEADRFPFLAQEQGLLEKRLAAHRPNLGICLGAQLLAAAAGSKVYPGAAGKVVGVLPVTLTAEALADPLFAGIDERFEVIHWHGDTWEPVHGAVLLASTARYPQEAFRLGNSYAFQFHPELDAANFERWLRAFPLGLKQAGREVEDALSRDLPRARRAMHPNMLLVERLAEFFAREVGAGGGERYLFTVTGALKLERRGVVLSPGIPRRTPIVRIGDPLVLRRPDASRLTGKVKGLGAFGAEGTGVPLLVQLDDECADAEIPGGTEALAPAAGS